MPSRLMLPLLRRLQAEKKRRVFVRREGCVAWQVGSRETEKGINFQKHKTEKEYSKLNEGLLKLEKLKEQSEHQPQRYFWGCRGEWPEWVPYGARLVLWSSFHSDCEQQQSSTESP
jgi:hypothetical protein